MADFEQNRREAITREQSLTVAEVKELVAEIDNLKHDNEAAHAKEDHLLVRVLLAVAGGHPNAAELAFTALDSQHIGYERWYA